MKTLHKEFKLQEAVTTIGVQRIINSIEEQYIKELNEDYFDYANQTIKTLLTHIRMNWCKVMTKERTNATEMLYHSWVPLTTHIITCGPQLNKQQKKCKNINFIILDEAKTLHFFGQMYKSGYYTKEQMTKYNMQMDVKKTWLHTLQFFTKYFAQLKAYGEDCAANSGFDSAAHINNIPTNHSLVSTCSDITTRNPHIENLKELLAAAWEYVAKEHTPTPDMLDPVALLGTGFDAQRKQFDLIMKQNSALLAAMAKGHGSGGGKSGGCYGCGGGGNRGCDCGTKAMCPICNKLVIHVEANCFTLPASKDKILTWYKPPKLD
jgi:hypothetical protein